MTTLDEKGLAPCPFCGAASVLNHGATDDYDITCRNPMCFGPSTPPFGLRDDAIAAWNRRAALPTSKVTGAARIPAMTDDEFNRDKSDENPNVGRDSKAEPVADRSWTNAEIWAIAQAAGVGPDEAYSPDTLRERIQALAHPPISEEVTDEEVRAALSSLRSTKP